jgi:hypothetical protein
VLTVLLFIFEPFYVASSGAQCSHNNAVLLQFRSYFVCLCVCACVRARCVTKYTNNHGADVCCIGKLSVVWQSARAGPPLQAYCSERGLGIDHVWHIAGAFLRLQDPTRRRLFVPLYVCTCYTLCMLLFTCTMHHLCTVKNIGIHVLKGDGRRLQDARLKSTCARRNGSNDNAKNYSLSFTGQAAIISHRSNRTV